MESPPPNPTRKTYGALDFFYDYFNKTLFRNELRYCLITMQRRRTACGFFASARFISRDGADVSDEIGLDPRYWGPPRTDRENLAVLVHEMTHLWQHHHGTSGRGGYHNRQFARKMFEVGLVASSTGTKGGDNTGTRMSQYILPGGPFDWACEELLGRGYVIPYVEILSKNDDQRRELEKRRLARAESKTTYTCPSCAPPVHVWGKPRLHIICGLCEGALVCEQPDRSWEAPPAAGG
jgi:hypothetical protein